MGLLSGLMKAGVAKKAIDIAREQAAKPENQAKAKEMLRKATGKGKRT